MQALRESVERTKRQRGATSKRKSSAAKNKKKKTAKAA